MATQAEDATREWRECLAARLADPSCEPELVEVAQSELARALETRAALLKEGKEDA